MNRQKTAFLALLASIAVFVTALTYWYVTLPPPTSKPSWLALGAYVTYEQAFTWGGHSETEYMKWNITRITGDKANLYLESHGVNVSGGNVAITEGEALWTVNMFSRVITNSSDSMYDGKKTGFWIENTTSLSSYVETMYGTSVISRSETINVLGQQKECWVTKYNWPTSTMERWYDKSSGIVLKIQVVLNREGVTIQVTETAVETNINL